MDAVSVKSVIYKYNLCTVTDPDQAFGRQSYMGEQKPLHLFKHGRFSMTIDGYRIKSG